LRIKEAKEKRKKILKETGKDYENLDQEDDDLEEVLEKSEARRWEELSLSEKLAIFNYWHIVYILSDLSLITGCLIMLIIKQEAFMMADFFIGFGCFFAWCSLPSFIHQTAKYSLITRTVSFTLPIVGKALLGVVPIFFGFAFLGLALFWDSYRYRNIMSSIFTCFAAMNGDSLYDIFYDIINFRFLLGMAYLMFFTFCGIV
jgi:Polycystin cation channel